MGAVSGVAEGLTPGLREPQQDLVAQVSPSSHLRRTWPEDGRRGPGRRVRFNKETCGVQKRGISLTPMTLDDTTLVTRRLYRSSKVRVDFEGCEGRSKDPATFGQVWFRLRLRPPEPPN